MSESFPPGRRRRPFLAAVAIIGAGAILWLWLSGSPPSDESSRPDPPPPDPRLVFETRHRNVRPDVQYVGDEACSGCHAEIARTYRNHPMGRSAEWVGRGPAADAHAAGSNNPVSAGTFQLRAGRDGDRVRHAMAATNLPAGAIPPYSLFADLAIGSGRQGKSYFSLEGGSVWQSPLSRFRRGDRWDVSPGFELGAASRRPVTPSCLFCHADTVAPVDGAINRYREPLFAFQPSIGCERCHGPGELHVAERSAKPAPGGLDDSIVNPARLAADLKGDV